MKGISIGPEMVHMGDLATKHEIDFFTNPIDSRKQTGGSMPELKPCPFCGGNAIVDSVIDGRHHGVDTWASKVRCARCYVTTQRYLGDYKYLGTGKSLFNIFSTRPK